MIYSFGIINQVNNKVWLVGSLAMKNKKISILMDGAKKVLQQMKKTQQAPNQQLTIKLSYQSTEGPAMITALQIKRLQRIFPQNSLQNLLDDFEQYLSLPSQILGKRSSKIVLSKSSQYLLKIIQQEDMNEITTMFQALLDRFQHCKSNCLVNIYYIFIVEHSISNVKIMDRYILMPNIRANFDQCIKTFDIKGHLQARVIDNDDFVDFKFGKDQNFVRSEQIDFIKKFTPKQTLSHLIHEIQQNINFLGKYGIIDYSLLFSLQTNSQTQLCHQPCRQIRINQNTVLKWIIIDYFQIYNQKKKLQNKFKSLFRKSVSSVEPEIYSKRLIDFLKKYLLS